MKKYLKYLLIPLSLYLLQGCCWTDHSDTIKKVAVPMQQELEDFYTKNKRFPNTQERDEMLVKVGCEMEGNVCVHGGERMLLDTERGNYNYNISYGVGYSYCYSHINFAVDKNLIHCYKEPCIRLKQ